ncbi:MAG: hypothetical protein SF069_05745 [Phycisphaerae bacterium]|nr:hypothetical protein [Phycisphaerae bacterium]
MLSNRIHDRCLLCGYSVVGHPEGAACPECGVAEDTARVRIQYSYAPRCWLLFCLTIVAWVSSCAGLGPLLLRTAPPTPKSSWDLVCVALFLPFALALSIAVTVYASRLIPRRHRIGTTAFAAGWLVGLMVFHMLWIAWWVGVSAF